MMAKNHQNVHQSLTDTEVEKGKPGKPEKVSLYLTPEIKSQLDALVLQRQQRKGKIVYRNELINEAIIFWLEQQADL